MNRKEEIANLLIETTELLNSDTEVLNENAAFNLLSQAILSTIKKHKIIISIIIFSLLLKTYLSIKNTYNNIKDRRAKYKLASINSFDPKLVDSAKFCKFRKGCDKLYIDTCKKIGLDDRLEKFDKLVNKLLSIKDWKTISETDIKNYYNTMKEITTISDSEINKIEKIIDDAKEKLKELEYSTDLSECKKAFSNIQNYHKSRKYDYFDIYITSDSDDAWEGWDFLTVDDETWKNEDFRNLYNDMIKIFELTKTKSVEEVEKLYNSVGQLLDIKLQFKGREPK